MRFLFYIVVLSVALLAIFITIKKIGLENIFYLIIAIIAIIGFIALIIWLLRHEIIEYDSWESERDRYSAMSILSVVI